MPKNTVSSTKWAMANFTSWKKARNKRFADDPEKQVLDDLLLSHNASLLNKWLKLYVAETRKQDGSKYPPKTLYQLLAGLLRDMRSRKPNCSNFLDPNDHRFDSLHNGIDNVFRELRSSGVGSDSKSAEAITKEEEAQLMEQGVLGTDSPRALLRAAFFLNGKNFCLRGGEEHRCLKLSQIKRYSAPDHYVYTENSSKNRSGGMAQMRVANKVVPIYATPEAGIRCHVNILDTYFSKLPQEAMEKDNFYLQPLTKLPHDPQKPWFSTIPVGRNTLAKMVKDICKEGQISGNKTNHSLRATGASELFQAGVPEKVIQERTGHLSLSGLRHYERTTDEQHRSVSQILSSSVNATFDKEVSMATMPTTVSHSRLPLQPIASMQSFRPVSQASFTPNMNFSGCSVMIYQGTNTAQLPPPVPVGYDISDLDVENFFADL